MNSHTPDRKSNHLVHSILVFAGSRSIAIRWANSRALWLPLAWSRLLHSFRFSLGKTCRLCERMRIRF